MMRNTLWKLKRKSLIRTAVKSAARDLRPMINFACERPAKIREISDYTIHLLETGKSLNDLQGSLSELASNSHTIPDVRNLLLGVARGCLKANENEHVLSLAKPMLSTIELASDHRLLPVLVRCSIESEDEFLALQIIAVGLEEQYCREVGIEIVSRIIQTDREQLDNVEISHSVEIILGELEGEFEFSTEDYKFLFRHFKETNQNLAIKLGLKIKEFDDPNFCRVLCRILNENDMSERSLNISSKVALVTKDSWHTFQVELAGARSRFPNEIFTFFEKYSTSSKSSNDASTISTFLDDNQSDIMLQYSMFNYLFKIHQEYRELTELAKRCAANLLNADVEQAEFRLKASELMMYDGNLTGAYDLLGNAESHPSVERKKRNVKSLMTLLDENCVIKPKFLHSTSLLKDNFFSNRVLYTLHNSLPFDSGGYASRSHGLLCGVQQNGWDIHAVTRLGYPRDLEKHKGKLVTDESIIDKIPYHRLKANRNGYGKIPLKSYIETYAENLHKLCMTLRPSILHGASNHMNGHAVNLVAQELGIPSVYEVRGLWEITRISRQPKWKEGDYYKLMSNMETKAAKDATAVICITQALADEMVSRGVDSNKITLVHNGVHVDRFTPRPVDRDLEKTLGTKGNVVIGYVGSIVDYEGLNLLVEAAENLIQRGIDNFIVLIVGDGAASPTLENIASNSSASKHFIFTGRVPHEEVENYYSLIDIAPFPRLSLPVTEMVSPLKPFEAMAMEKLVIASNVAALEEIVNHEVTGLLFKKDNVDSLTDALELGISDSKLRTKLGKQAREWVKEERDWKILSQKVTQLYDSLIETSNE